MPSQYSQALWESPVAERPLTKLPLWRHQEESFAFAYPKAAALLALDMGCGKSAVAIALLNARQLSPVLILCPKSVIPVWPAQFATHSVLDYRVVALDDAVGSVTRRAQRAARELERGGPLALVMNYEACWRSPMRELLESVAWGAIVCDESHKIKSHNGKASRFLGRLGPRARYRYALTGTPLPHSPLDAFGQYRFLDPTLYGSSWTRFKGAFCEMGGYGGYEVVGYKNMQEFNRRFYTIAIRFKASDVLDLPEATHTERFCQLSPAARRLYRQLEDAFYTEVEAGTVTVSNALTKLLRLQQLTSGYLALDDGTLQEVDTAKQDLLLEVLGDLDEKEPVVVFCRFRADLAAVQAAGAALGRPVAELSGAVRQLTEWQRGEYTILAAQLQAGGVGVDFSRARIQIYYSLGFSLGDYEQSLKRIHRPGQTRNVLYITLTAQHTVDEKVRDALAARKEIVEYILRNPRKGAR